MKVAAVYVTVAPIGVVVPCLTRVTLVVVTDVGSSASLNVAVGATFSGWPVAPLAGVVLATVGGVVSGGGPPLVVFRRIVTSLLSQSAVATSIRPSPSMSPVAIANGVVPTVNDVGAESVPVPDPSRMLTWFPPGLQQTG